MARVVPAPFCPFEPVVPWAPCGPVGPVEPFLTNTILTSSLLLKVPFASTSEALTSNKALVELTVLIV